MDMGDLRSQGDGPLDPEPVREARRILREWELRHGHDSYVNPLNGGCRGYQARCWDCDWTGPEHLRGDEQMGTPESRVHKNRVRAEAAQHRRDTRPAVDHWTAAYVASAEAKRRP